MWSRATVSPGVAFKTVESHPFPISIGVRLLIYSLRHHKSSKIVRTGVSSAEGTTLKKLPPRFLPHPFSSFRCCQEGHHRWCFRYGLLMRWRHKNKLLTRPTIGLNILSLAPPHRRPPRLPPPLFARSGPSPPIVQYTPCRTRHTNARSTPDCRAPHPWERHWATPVCINVSTFNVKPQSIRQVFVKRIIPSCVDSSLI